MTARPYPKLQEKNTMNLREMIKKATDREDAALIEAVVPKHIGRDEAAVKQFLDESVETAELLKALMTTHRGHVPQRMGVTTKEGQTYLNSWQRDGDRPAPLSFNETLMSNDASLMFKRVISDVLMLPKEQDYIGQTVLARTIRIDGVRSAQFPALGAISAGPIAETGEYPEALAGFTKHMLELKVQKHGLRIAIADEVIEDSMWDIFGLYVTMCSSACDRWKEEQIFNTALAAACTVFDNSLLEAAAVTQGQDAAGDANGSVDFRDLMDLFGGLLANGYIPTDIVLHPLTWTMLAKDPRLLFHLLNSGNYNQSVPMPGLDAGAIKKNLPFGSINVVVTPQMEFRFNQVVTMLSGGSSVVMPAANTADILCLDRQATLLVLQREDKHMDEFDDLHRDIHNLKVSERYAIGALDEGRGITAIKNIRLVENLRPVFNVGMGVVS